MTTKTLKQISTPDHERLSDSQAPVQSIDNPLTATTQVSLPVDGYSRASQLLPFLPIGVSTLWKWAKNGQFPAPIKLSPTVTAWRNKDVHDWFNAQAEKANIDTLTPANDDNNSDGVA